VNNEQFQNEIQHNDQTHLTEDNEDDQDDSNVARLVAAKKTDSWARIREARAASLPRPASSPSASSISSPSSRQSLKPSFASSPPSNSPPERRKRYNKFGDEIFDENS